MPTDLLTLCQDAANEIGIREPSSIVGNSSQDSRQFLAMANRIGRDISQATRWQYLDIEGMLTLVLAQQAYDLPADLDKFIDLTMWNRDLRRPVVIPLSPKEWQYYEGWVFIQGLNLRARIQGNQFVFQQDITTQEAGNELFFEYRSRSWATDDTGAVNKEKFTVDTDLTKHQPELHSRGIIYLYKKAKGLPDWQSDYQLYRKQLITEIAADGGARTARMGGKRTPYLGANVPDGNYGI